MEKRSAPDGLALVESFLRTRGEPALLAWLDRHGGGPTDAAAVSGVREALRALAAANNGAPAAPSAYATLNAALRDHGVVPQLTPGGVRWSGGEGPLGEALTAVLGAVVTAVVDGTWRRCKVCAADDCTYFFYDHTRNHSTRWCDVAGCGVNARMRAYRSRRAAAGSVRRATRRGGAEGEPPGPGTIGA